MKRYVFSVLLALTFIFTGLQAVFLPADAAAFRGNAAAPEALPAELKDLDVQDDFVDSGAQHAGFLETVIGHVVVLHEDSKEAFFAARGDAIFKHDTIFTLKGSRSRIKFSTEDVITMGENAKLGLEEYIDNRSEKNKKSIFNMLRGKAMFYAVRLFKYRTTSVVVKTPTAVLGVRGTKFGVEVRKEGDKIAANGPVYLADASGAGFQYLLAQSIPGGLVTVAYCFSGEIDVTALADNTTQTLNANESRMATSERGVDKRATPPDVARQFESDTEAPEPPATEDAGAGEAEKGEGTDESEEDEEAGESVVDTGGDTGTTETNLADKAADQTSTITDQTLNTPTRPTVHKGYFTGMLTHQPSGPFLDNVYVSSSRQNFDSTLVSAEGLYNLNGPNFVYGKPGSGFGDPLLKKVSLDTGSAIESSTDNLDYSITHGEIGYNSYQEWGWWYVAVQTIKINSQAHDLFHKNYYIFGDPTPDAAVAGISGTYSGDAWGTFWDPSVSGEPEGIKGIGMTGTFSFQVNGAASAPQITNFDLSVAGGGHTASITDETGTFSSSSFRLNSDGTWVINGNPANYQDGAGSLYGPNGEYVGGGYGIKAWNGSTYDGVEGIFQGAKQ